MKMKRYLGYLPAGICILYYLLVCLVTARLGGAQMIWLCAAAFLGFVQWLRLRVKDRSRRKENAVKEKMVLRICMGLLVVGLLCGGIIEGVILTEMIREPEPHGDYVIILGAKVNGTTPSLTLKYRIDSAAEYLKEYPESVAIASGGQGADEGIAEGKAIEEALLQHGIEPERILLEDRSTSTEENLLFSKELIRQHGGAEDSSVVIVTSDFHMYRALKLADKLGFSNASGKTAKVLWALIPQNHLREVLAIGYYFVTGTL